MKIHSAIFRLAVLVGAFAGLGQAAAVTNCTISNLPASFSIRMGGPSNGTGETAVVSWDNFANTSTGVQNICYDDNGGSAVVYGPGGINLINGSFVVYIRSTDATYKSIVDQLRLAKANLLQTDVNVRLINYDAKSGFFLNSVSVK